MGFENPLLTKTGTSQASAVYFFKDFNSRRGDDSSIITYREGPQLQQQDFCPEQVMTRALDTWCETLIGVPVTDHDGVRHAVVETAADTALEWDPKRQQ